MPARHAAPSVLLTRQPRLRLRPSQLRWRLRHQNGHSPADRAAVGVLVAIGRGASTHARDWLHGTWDALQGSCTLQNTCHDLIHTPICFLPSRHTIIVRVLVELNGPHRQWRRAALRQGRAHGHLPRRPGCRVSVLRERERVEAGPRSSLANWIASKETVTTQIGCERAAAEGPCGAHGSWKRGAERIDARHEEGKEGITRDLGSKNTACSEAACMVAWPPGRGCSVPMSPGVSPGAGLVKPTPIWCSASLRRTSGGG